MRTLQALQVVQTWPAAMNSKRLDEDLRHRDEGDEGQTLSESFWIERRCNPRHWSSGLVAKMRCR